MLWCLQYKNKGSFQVKSDRERKLTAYMSVDDIDTALQDRNCSDVQTFRIRGIALSLDILESKVHTILHTALWNIPCYNYPVVDDVIPLRQYFGMFPNFFKNDSRASKLEITYWDIFPQNSLKITPSGFGKILFINSLELPKMHFLPVTFHNRRYIYF